MKATTTIATLLALVLLAAGAAQARKGRGPGPGPGPGPGHHGGPPPGLFGPEELEELAGELGLKKEQKQAIRDIADEAHKQMVKVRADVEVAEIDLRRELDKDEPDEKKVNEHIDRITQLEGQMKKIHVGALLKIRKVLTKDQRAKLDQLHDKKKKEMRERHEQRERERRDGPE